MQKTFSNGENITMKDWKEIDNMIEKLDLSILEAIQLREFDKFNAAKKDEFELKPKVVKTKKGITDDEIEELFNLIKLKFKDESFKNKEFHLMVADKYTNRQTPSRLKRMVEKGWLEDLGGTPKKYKVKGI